jgi:DNA-binding transcriptional MerR regulator
LDKAPDAFRTISEVAEETDVPQHVLRFWESRFSQIKPLKRGGGRRYYRPDDVDLLRGIRHLLYGEGYTIRGVQRLLREEGLAFVQNVWRGDVAHATAENLIPDDHAPHHREGADDDESERDADAEPVMRPVPAVAVKASRSARREPVLPVPAVEARDGTELAAKSAIRVEPRPDAWRDSGVALHPIGNERRHALQAALDELIACRRLIDRALSEPVSTDITGAGDNPTTDASRPA